MTGSVAIKNGKYYAILNIIDENGKRKQKWVPTGLEAKGNKKRAEKIKDDLVKKYEDKNIKYKDLLVSDYFSEWLINTKNMVTPSTYRSYESNMKNHIIPYFKEKKIKLQDLKLYHLEDYYTTKSNKNSSLKKNKTLSAQTIKHQHQNISKALNDAVKREIIRFNPATNAKSPKVKKFRGNFLNTKQINELLLLIKDSVIEIPLILIAAYGMRRSEALAISWKNVDFVNEQITISSAIIQHTGGDYENNVTKNESSYRTLPFTNQIKNILLKHKANQEDNKKIFGDCYINNDYVCTWKDGKPISPNYLTRTFDKIIKESSLPKIRLHDLRHSTASNLLANGISVVEVQHFLGHSQPSTTLNFYSHVDSSSKKNISNFLEKNLKFSEC